MAHNEIRRGAATVGTTIIAVLLLAGPAMASRTTPQDEPDVGTKQSANMQFLLNDLRYPPLGVSAQSANMRSAIDELRSQRGRPALVQPTPAHVLHDETSVPYVQIGLGAFGVAALIGGVAASRRHQSAAHPA